MGRRSARSGLILGVALATVACGGPGRGVVSPTTAPPPTIELTETPFFPQEAYQCGPAALATVLRASGVEVSPEDLSPQVYLPARRGSLQLELIAASRRHGRLPYPIHGGPAEIAAELSAGRPVLVMQNLGLGPWPVWHYAVVVGADGRHDRYILRSGAKERLVVSGRRFLRSWRLADHWAVVMLRPGELPSHPDKTRYLTAAAAFEETSQGEMARAAYHAALERWPGDRVARFGLGSVALSAGESKKAEAIYRALLVEEPGDAIARNNLAEALADQGCVAAALQEIDTARARAGTTGPLAEILAQTRREIVERAATGAPDPCRQEGR